MPGDIRILDLKQKVNKLPLREERWEVTMRRARVWITPHKQPPYRPYVCLIVNGRGKIIGTKMFEQPLTAELLFAELLQAMKRPMFGSGPAGRPTLIYLDDADQVAALTPLLAEVGVACAYQTSSMEVEEALSVLESHLNKGNEFMPGLVEVPSIPDALLEHFYQLVAEYYRAMPWRWLTDQHPLEMRYPPMGKPRYAVVMGSGGEVFGLAVYDSLKDLRTIYREDLSPVEVLRLTTSMALYFEDIFSMSFADLDAIEEHGWPIAAENAYPVFVRTIDERHFDLPSLSDIIWMEAGLAALLVYLREYKQLSGSEVQPAELTIPIQTISGPAEVYLRFPAFDPMNP